MERGSGEVGGARANTTTKTGNDEEDRRNQKDFFSLFVSFFFLPSAHKNKLAKQCP